MTNARNRAHLATRGVRPRKPKTPKAKRQPYQARNPWPDAATIGGWWLLALIALFILGEIWR